MGHIMKGLFLICLFALCASSTPVEEENDNYRDPKFLSLFDVVQFDNNYCNSTSDETGTCLTSTQCISKEGTASGSCAEGFGVCCVLKDTCGGSTNLNNTYFTNPGYSSTYSENGMCIFTVNKCANNICQLRLEFDEFELAAPSDTGDCETDFFTTTGGDANAAVGSLCGLNTGQHMYIQAGSGTTCTLKNVLGAASTVGRKWKIKIIQIPCDSPYLAPAGCNQYYYGHSGTIQSFNYKDNTNQHLNSITQNVCFRPEQGFCKIEYKETASVTEAFSISNDAAAAVAANGADCTKDYILIPNGEDAVGNKADRYCGGSLVTAAVLPVTTNEPITAPLPFTFTFKSDATDPTTAVDMGSYGFSVDFEQKPCEVL